MPLHVSFDPPILTLDASDTESSTTPAAAAQDLLRAALAPRFAVDVERSRVEVLTHLDTVDGRLHQAGIDLAHLPRRRRLVAIVAGVQTDQQVTGVRWPALATDLPAGAVIDLVRKPAWIRALIPYASTEADTTTFAVRNSDGKIVVRIHWTAAFLTQPASVRIAARVGIEALRGYRSEADQVRAALLETTSLVPSVESWFDTVRTLPALRPKVAERFGMQPDQAADFAVADALLGYLAELDATVDGIIADIDTEYLHDFRVAVRRTRTVLKLLGDVLPPGLAGRTAPEFRWLGDVTTPTRDLDVYLLELDDLAATVTHPDDLSAFGAYVRERRASAQRELAKALKSKRYTDLVESWRAALAEVIAHPSHAEQTASDLAVERLHKVFAKCQKRSRKITADSHSELVHDLRKACKEMRYLMEVFKPLCDKRAYKNVIADFKELQDLLGEFQDGEVQAAALRQFAHEMVQAGKVDANAILAMGELSGKFEARQRAARETLTEHHENYLGRKAAAHVDRLVRK
ncbi:MAG: CHAD domain-containing protein [Microlunatus sp.]|nr:CHAD domain-containing protein [Microlunatus sp.]MDN5770563.1 CHAD domain-containing protein [Microlunatus sp.]